MKPLEFKISFLVESYDETTVEMAKLPKSAQFPNYQIYQFQIFIAQIKDLNKDCVNILFPHLLCFPNNKPTKSVTIGLGRIGSDRFNVLNDSASHKMIMKMYYYFIQGFRAVSVSLMQPRYDCQQELRSLCTFVITYTQINRFLIPF